MASKYNWDDFGWEKMNSDLERLVAISNYYGSDPDFLLAGGGNTSAKTEDRMFILTGEVKEVLRKGSIISTDCANSETDISDFTVSMTKNRITAEGLAKRCPAKDGERSYGTSGMSMEIHLWPESFIN